VNAKEILGQAVAVALDKADKQIYPRSIEMATNLAFAFPVAFTRGVRRFDQPANLIRAPDHGQMNFLLRIGHLLAPWAFQHLDIEEAQRPDSLVHRVLAEMLVTKQVDGIFADLLGPELIGGAVEITRQVLNRCQIDARGTLSVVATRDFIERHFSKLGHKDLLVAHTYRRAIPKARPTVHAKRPP